MHLLYFRKAGQGEWQIKKGKRVRHIFVFVYNECMFKSVYMHVLPL